MFSEASRHWGFTSFGIIEILGKHLSGESEGRFFGWDIAIRYLVENGMVLLPRGFAVFLFRFGIFVDSGLLCCFVLGIGFELFASYRNHNDINTILLIKILIIRFSYSIFKHPLTSSHILALSLSLSHSSTSSLVILFSLSGMPISLDSKYL